MGRCPKVNFQLIKSAETGVFPSFLQYVTVFLEPPHYNLPDGLFTHFFHC